MEKDMIGEIRRNTGIALIGESFMSRLSANSFRIATVVLLCIALSFMNESFFTAENILNILRQMAVLLVLSLGQTLVILTAGIDLSGGAVMSLAGCVAAMLLSMNVPIPFVILAGMLIGVLCGTASGLLVGVIRLPPFVATYGVMWIASGVALILMQGQIIFGLSENFRFLSTGHVGIVPMIVIISLVLTVVAHLIATQTVFGKHVFALGANREAAFYSGIRTTRTLVMVYALSGVSAAVAGMLLTGRLDAAEAGMGDSFQMLAIASVVMGGTSLMGGEGGLLGTLIGVLILILVVNGMNLLDVPSLAQSLVTGVVILIAVFADALTKARS